MTALDRVDQSGRELIGLAGRKDARQDEGPDAAEVADVGTEGLVDLRGGVLAHDLQGLIDLGPIEDRDVGRLLQAGLDSRPQSQVEDRIAAEILDVGDHEPVAILEGQTGAPEEPDGDGDGGQRHRARRDPDRPRPPPERQSPGRRMGVRAHGLLELAEVGGHLPGRGIAVPRVLGQGLADDAGDLGREAGPEILHGPRLFMDDSVENRPVGVARERQGPCRHFVKDDAQGPEIGPGIDLVAAGLFGDM